MCKYAYLDAHISLYTYVHTYTFKCTNPLIYIRTNINYTFICTHTSKCTNPLIYIRTNINYTFICTYLCAKHTHLHTYIYTVFYIINETCMQYLVLLIKHGVCLVLLMKHAVFGIINKTRIIIYTFICTCLCAKHTHLHTYIYTVFYINETCMQYLVLLIKHCMFH